MIAVGLCNIAGSFFGSYPVCASFSRAAVGSASGVRTPLSGIYTGKNWVNDIDMTQLFKYLHNFVFLGIMVILAFSFLTPYFSYIPKATLAAVIICAVIFMIEIAITKMIWRINSKLTLDDSMKKCIHIFLSSRIRYSTVCYYFRFMLTYWHRNWNRYRNFRGSL